MTIPNPDICCICQQPYALVSNVPGFEGQWVHLSCANGYEKIEQDGEIIWIRRDKGNVHWYSAGQFGGSGSIRVGNRLEDFWCDYR